MMEAKEAMDELMKSMPPYLAEVIRNHQEAFLIGYLYGHSNEDLDYCKQNYPELDWDSKEAEIIINVSAPIVNEWLQRKVDEK